MEKKTTQRIIGILVVVALVIILMPLMLDKNEAATKVAAVKAPPFPDEAQPAAPTTLAADDKKGTSGVIDIPPEIADKINKAANETPVDTKQSGIEIKSAAEPVAVASAPVATPAVAPAPAEDAQLQSAEAKPTPSDAPLSVISAAEKPVADKIVKADEVKSSNKASVAKHVVKTASATRLSAHSLKKTAWALQLGSFKSKENAQRLTDRLRSAGYKAFTHTVKSATGMQIRVYIGPEFKHATVAKLSSKLEQQMNIHSFVVPFKPLEI